MVLHGVRGLGGVPVRRLGVETPLQRRPRRRGCVLGCRLLLLSSWCVVLVMCVEVLVQWDQGDQGPILSGCSRLGSQVQNCQFLFAGLEGQKINPGDSLPWCLFLDHWLLVRRVAMGADSLGAGGHFLCTTLVRALQWVISKDSLCNTVRLRPNG